VPVALPGTICGSVYAGARSGWVDVAPGETTVAAVKVGD
jgi:hypothetical protein